jgi:hypothetical protein
MYYAEGERLEGEAKLTLAHDLYRLLCPRPEICDVAIDPRSPKPQTLNLDRELNCRRGIVSVLRCRGKAAGHKSSQATVHFETAVEQCKEMGEVPEQAHNLMDLAELTGRIGMYAINRRIF